MTTTKSPAGVSYFNHENQRVSEAKNRYNEISYSHAKPFLKWAGGKGQLLLELEKRLPSKIKESKMIERYFEPFVGGGAFFFHLRENYIIRESYLSDINKELIIGYRVIQKNPHELIYRLLELQNRYYRMDGQRRKEFFYQIRILYNDQIKDFDYINYNNGWIDRACHLIFLNKTCYNGLFRQNKRGLFNVPFGKYRNPKICDEINILEVNKALANTKIICDDFKKSENYIEKGDLVYIDPPYRPISKTSNFTDYSNEGFTDEDHKRLAEFFNEMNKKEAYLILSNSDPKNYNPEDSFFDILYKGYSIENVKANRMINCNPEKRGRINELIISNYKGG